MRVHTGAERCSCPECGASFSKRQKLNYHMRKHTGEGLLHCPLCTRPATNSYSHKKHLETHQTVLGRLLQGAGVLGQAEDCQRLAIRTLHNLAWVSASARVGDQAAPSHAPRLTPPVVEDKVRGFEGEIQQMLSSDTEKEKKVNIEDSEDVKTAIEHIDVTVKVESPEELDEPVHSPSKTEGKSSSLRQFRKVNRKMDILTDPLEVKDLQHNKMIQQYDDVKTEVLSYIMNLRCTQFNEAVEKYKLEAAIKEGKDSLHNKVGNNSLKNNEGNTDEVEDVPVYKDMEATISDLNRSMINKKEVIGIEMPADENTLNVAWEQMKECSYNLMEEPLVVLARLWQLIIEPKDGQQHCERITQFSSCWLKEQDIQMEADKNTSCSKLNLRIQSEAEQDETMTWTKQETSELEMDSEASECEDRPS